VDKISDAWKAEDNRFEELAQAARRLAEWPENPNRLAIHPRPNWHQTMMAVAETMSFRSTCPRAQTGCIIATPDNQILTTGYNGAPRGIAHCTDVGCDMLNGHCIRAIHAEQNALVQAARVGVSVRDGELYATHRPCIRCSNMIIQAGIASVIFREDYDTDRKLDAVTANFATAGVLLFKVDSQGLLSVV